MKALSIALQDKKTYIAAGLIILYGIVFRGLGANDWNTGLIMISVAVIGICLKLEMPAPTVCNCKS